MKRQIRAFAVWLRTKTDYWVVPKEVWELVDQDDFIAANAALDAARKQWPDDPEVAYADALINRFLKD